MRIDVQLDDRQVQEALAKLQAHGHDAKTLLLVMGEQALTQNEERHRKEVDPNGKSWEPLKPSTRRTKTQDRMLFETGSMLRLHVRSVGSKVLVGTNDEKAQWHHFGTRPYQILPKRTRVLASKIAGIVFGKQVNHPGLPARSILGINRKDMREMRDDLVQRLEQDVRDAH